VELKKTVLKLRSISNIVIAPARTGKERRSKNAVIRMLHTNRGIVCRDIPGARMLKMVTIKLIAPRIEDMPARCRLKIPKSTAAPECASMPLRGGYTVQPVPTPTSTKEERSSKESAGGSNQKLRLLSRGKAMSGAPIRMGTNQFPKPPTITGITMKKIIINAWAVTITLYS